MSKNDNRDFYDRELISIVQANQCLYDKRIQKDYTPAMMEDMWLQVGHILFQKHIPILGKW